MTTSPHDDYADLVTVGDRLRLARERRTDMDQEQFAEHINVSRGTVSNYERNKLPGGRRQKLVLNAWAAATGTTRYWLETGKIPGQPAPDGGNTAQDSTDGYWAESVTPLTVLAA